MNYKRLLLNNPQRRDLFFLRRILNRFGLEITSLKWDLKRNHRVYFDLDRHFTSGKPVIFDVGANTGQSIERYKNVFPHSIIHSFEPGTDTFQELKRKAEAGYSDIFTYHVGLGSEVGQLKLMENSNSVMSSFLPIAKDGWGEIVNETMVDVITVDGFISDHGIERVDLLKIDTQGFEMEVLKGAVGSIDAGKIGMVFLEMIFSEMYLGSPGFIDIFEFMHRHNFRLVSMYNFNYKNGIASWADSLFIHDSYCNRNQ